MNTISIEKGKTRLIAHRGVSDLECENTCAAFVAAGNRSYWGIETDVYVTADKACVIFHDDTTERLTGVNLKIEDSTLEQLRALTLRSPIPGDVPERSDLKIPMLCDYLSICKKYEKIAVLEIKYPMALEDVDVVLREVEESGYMENVVFISFGWDIVVHIREKYPNQRVQYLWGVFDDDLIRRLIEHKIDFDTEYHAVTPELVDTLHKAGREVNCWTCDNKEEAEKLIELGVDYITTDILE